MQAAWLLLFVPVVMEYGCTAQDLDSGLANAVADGAAQTPADNQRRVFISLNYPNYAIGFDNNKNGYIVNGVWQVFEIVPGLNDVPGTCSLRSRRLQNHYLRHENFLLKVQLKQDNNQYKNDATFFLRQDKFFPGFISFEAQNFPEYFIRHQYLRLNLHPLENSDLYRRDSSFRMSSYLPITRAHKFISHQYPTRCIGFKLNDDLAYANPAPFRGFAIVSPGLNENPGTVSLMPVNKRQFYLRHQGFQLKLHPWSIDELYRQDATFTIRPNRFFDGTISFESFNYPNFFVKVDGELIKLVQFQNSDEYKKGASFRLDDCCKTGPMRCLNENGE